MLSGIRPTAPIGMAAVSQRQFQPVASPLTLTATADRFVFQTQLPPPPAPSQPTTPPTRDWKQTVRMAATFAVPTVVGAGLGLGIAAATGASLGIGALIGAGVGLAAVVGVVVFALKRFT